MQGKNKRPRKSAMLDETGRRVVAAKYPSSRGTPERRKPGMTSANNRRRAGAGQIQLLGCPLCSGARPSRQRIFQSTSGCKKIEKSIEICLTKALVHHRVLSAARW